MRVLTAKHRMDFDDLALKIECFQIMGKAHQVSLRRQFVLRMTPITVAENPQLTAVDKFLQAILDVKK